MIGQLEGTIWDTRDRSITLGVGGVGYKLWVTTDTAIELKDKKTPVRMWTHLSVREDALELYGFLSEAELHLFELIISVSGIGPKKAISILSLAPAPTLMRAIATGDAEYLTKVSGVGRKNAEKIVLELREKMIGLASEMPQENMQDEADIIEAIRALGYSAHEARKALAATPASITGVSGRIKAALKILSSPQ